MELEVVILENGIEYAIVKEIDNYLLLINPKDETDFCIRKNVVRDGQEFIESLDSDEEFEKAFVLFGKFLQN